MTPPLRRILVAVGFPAAADQPGLDKAVALARQVGARVSLYHAAFDPDAGARGAEHLAWEMAQVVALRELQLQRLAARHASERIDQRVEWTQPAHEGIAREARRLRADLVVGQSARHGLGRLLLTFPDWQLIRHVDAPLLLVKSPRAWERRTWLAAIDPRHEHDKPAALDRRILQWTRRLATVNRAPVLAVHAHPPALRYLPGTVLQPVPSLAPPAAQRVHSRAVRERVLRVTRRLRWPASRVSVQVGAIEDVLPKVATDLDAAVTVLGAISRSLLQRWLIGATAERLLDRLPGDILVIHPGSAPSSRRRSR